MTLRQVGSYILRRVFPAQMELRDLRREHKNELARLEKNTLLTHEQWVERIKVQYKRTTGREVDLENPRRFTEKITWRMLYDNDPRYPIVADKYAVREWVRERIGDEHLIPLLGVWDQAEDIKFRKLPDKFVLKTNNAYNTNIIVTDKRKINKKQIIENLNYWLKMPFWAKAGEMHYKSIEPKIIAEKYMLPDDLDDLPDYKFFCFDGKVFCLYTMIDVADYHKNGKLGYFDRDYNLLPYHNRTRPPIEKQLPKPENFEKMIEIAEILSKGFSHVRVDLYNVHGKIYFGEMTLTTSSGRALYEPDSFDFILGEQWNLDTSIKGNSLV